MSEIKYKSRFHIFSRLFSFNTKITTKVGIEDDTRNLDTIRYTKNTPLLDWGYTNVTNKPLFKKKINICFCDNRITRNQMYILIEFPYKNCLGVGIFIEKKGSIIEIVLRKKEHKKKDHIVLYKDCKFIGLNSHLVYDLYNNVNIEYSIVVSNNWQDKTLFAMILSDSEVNDFKNMIDYINDYIQDIVAETTVNNEPLVTPLLNVIKEHEFESEKNIAIAEFPIILDNKYIKVETDDENS